MARARIPALCNKAVTEAWKREQALVREGKGTRDWTPEQQRDILEKERAYDENGKVFEGHHMQSVEAYPQYQGDSDNIQFLTCEEHKEAAHLGSYRNPTNWYYDPETGEFFDFGEGKYTPCAVKDLSEPIANTIRADQEEDQQFTESLQPEQAATSEEDYYL